MHISSYLSNRSFSSPSSLSTFFQYTDAVHECTTPSVVTSWSCGRVCQLVSDVSEHKHCTQMSFGSSLLDCCLPMEWDLYTYILCGLIGLGILRTILSILISVCCRKRGCNIFLHASLTTQRFHVAFQVLLDVCLVALSAFMYTTFRHALALHAIIIILGMGGLAFVLLSFDLYGIFRALSSARASLFVGPFRVFTIDDVSQGLHINELRFGAMDGTETSHLGSESYLKPDEISNYSYLP